MSIRRWLADITPCTECGHPRNAHGRVAKVWLRSRRRTMKQLHWRCARCECTRRHWMPEVKMCEMPGCVLAASHPPNEHRTRRMTALACPHNVPNFGPSCVICDQLYV